MDLKIVIDHQQDFKVREMNDTVFLNDSPESYTLHKITSEKFLLTYHHKVYEVQILKRAAQKLDLSINGVSVTVDIKDHIAQILEELGMDTTVEAKVSEINAPMPGGILEIAVSEGSEVKKGDTLLILEAMKMENVIKSPIDGTISAVKVKVGDTVQKNQSLLSF